MVDCDRRLFRNRLVHDWRIYADCQQEEMLVEESTQTEKKGA